MGNVPNKLHFVSPLAPFHPNELANIADWAIYNPQFETAIWLPPALHQHTATELRDILATQRVTNDITEITTPDSVAVEWLSLDGQTTYTVTCKNFSSIPARCPVEALHALLTKLHKHHVVRDIAAMWVLFHEGGVFVDKETRTGDTSMPTDIHAPHGLLLAKFHRSHPQLVNNMMAAPPQSDAVHSLHFDFTQKYVRHFTLQKDQPLRLSMKVCRDLSKLKRYEDQIKLHQNTALRDELSLFGSDEARKAREESAAIRRRLKMYTQHNNDVIKQWMDKQMQPADDAMQSILASSEDHAHLLRCDDEQAFKEWEHFERQQKERLLRQDVDEMTLFLSYCLQDQTGFHPVIPPSAVDFVVNAPLPL